MGGWVPVGATLGKLLLFRILVGMQKEAQLAVRFLDDNCKGRRIVTTSTSKPHAMERVSPESSSWFVSRMFMYTSALEMYVFSFCESRSSAARTLAM